MCIPVGRRQEMANKYRRIKWK